MAKHAGEFVDIVIMQGDNKHAVGLAVDLEPKLRCQVEMRVYHLAFYLMGTWSLRLMMGTCLERLGVPREARPHGVTVFPTWRYWSVGAQRAERCLEG